MRGKAQRAFYGIMTIRITPAYAGKSQSSHYQTGKHKDHPRLCGEKELYATGLKFQSRITPAYAGKSLISIQSLFLDEDHPRLCGEKFSLLQVLPAGPGSPPPMRGKAKKPDSGQQKRRITPAYAGKRWILLRFFRTQKDHPRLCGEKFGHKVYTSF